MLNNIIKNKIDKNSWIENYKKILITMIPVIPHFANECLSKLKIQESSKEIKWPTINQNILEKDKVNFVVQINGKKRGILSVDKNIDEKEILIKINEDTKIKKFIENKNIKNTIFIPNKLVNIIVDN